MDYKIFLEWPFWLVVGLFFLTFPIMDKVEAMMTTKDTLYPALVFLLPIAAVSGDAGLTIFNTTTTKLECWDGAVWQQAW